MLADLGKFVGAAKEYVEVRFLEGGIPCKQPCKLDGRHMEAEGGAVMGT